MRSRRSEKTCPQLVCSLTPTMAPRNLDKAKDTLILLANSRPTAAKKILKSASNTVIKAIAELALNCLNGVIPLSSAAKKKMSRHKNSMRHIAGGSNIAAKRRVIQRGGFLGALLGTVLPLAIKGISALVGHIKHKKKQKRARARK